MDGRRGGDATPGIIKNRARPKLTTAATEPQPQHLQSNSHTSTNHHTSAYYQVHSPFIIPKRTMPPTTNTQPKTIKAGNCQSQRKPMSKDIIAWPDYAICPNCEQKGKIPKKGKGKKLRGLFSRTEEIECPHCKHPVTILKCPPILGFHHE